MFLAFKLTQGAIANPDNLIIGDYIILLIEWKIITSLKSSATEKWRKKLKIRS